MAFTEVFAGLPVWDLDAARAWYERLLGRPPDLIPNDNEAAWQLAGSGWIYLVGDAERAGAGQLTLLVDDLDACVAAIERCGLGAPAIETIPGAVRTTTLTDPAGNRIQIGQPLQSA